MFDLPVYMKVVGVAYLGVVAGSTRLFAQGLIDSKFTAVDLLTGILTIAVLWLAKEVNSLGKATARLEVKVETTSEHSDELEELRTKVTELTGEVDGLKREMEE